MPTYVYRCPKHGLFERVRRITEDVSTYTCPKCDNECQQEYQAPPPPIGFEKDTDFTKMQRGAPTKVYLNDRRKRRAS